MGRTFTAVHRTPHCLFRRSRPKLARRFLRVFSANNCGAVRGGERLRRDVFLRRHRRRFARETGLWGEGLV